MHTLRDIMSTDCVTVAEDSSLYEAACKMKDNDIGFVPVVEGDRMVGVVTDRDLVVRGYAEKHSGSTSVNEVMSNSITTACPDTSIDEASQMMAREQIRRLPIVEEERLLGVVSIGDLATHRSSEDEAGEALSEISEKRVY
ncbi:CBS domain-containing protein [Longirhabdus pacifica]|uniref:CBS domain-containing protein n=1 Tax=Longirhabdus pacifica TaxID=2305227 RepID=UPI0010086F03|nr:CBS domain-containing protein [Longirhabdus pacifica]